MGKCVGKLFYANPQQDWGLARNPSTADYFNPLRGGVVAFVCTLIRHAILDSKSTAPGARLKLDGFEYIDGEYQFFALSHLEL